MSEEWKTLDDNAKVQYQAMSDREKEKYDREMKVYKDKIAKANAVADAAADKGEKQVGKKRNAPAPKVADKGAKGKPAPKPAAKPSAKKEVIPKAKPV